VADCCEHGIELGIELSGLTQRGAFLIGRRTLSFSKGLWPMELIT